MNNSLIVEPLGLFGWSHLEPVILAALASESPMLLIGKHGSAKSFILERLAESLNLEYRCYNASLINYDDLVGIPVPVNNNTSLSYISNPNSIWDAEVVFIDELNRTKPELQNKLFPIIYDKRVQGTNLTKLKYRWAAMNPPSKDDDDEDISYIGAMPLDPALADRFPFIIEVPTWDDLSDADKKKILIDNHLGRHEFPVDIHELINQTKECYNDILKSKDESFFKYIMTLMDLLKNSFGYFSARRATMLEDSLIYLFAASKILNKRFNIETSFSNVAYLHIQNTIPNIANEYIDKVLLMNICNQAINLSNLADSVEKDILLISDPIERLKVLIKNKKTVKIEIINDVITSSLNEITDSKIRRAMALFTYLSFRSNRNIHAAVIETLANEIRPILETKTHTSMESLRKRKCADAVISLMNDVPTDVKYRNYLNNYLCSYLPDGYLSEDEPKTLFDFFVKSWEELEL
ncbi:MAG: MoxR family ATPase [Clostridia bacterium]|nr:MoxR family ATPase [Clostridia bacterium]